MGNNSRGGKRESPGEEMVFRRRKRSSTSWQKILNPGEEVVEERNDSQWDPTDGSAKKRN